VNARSGTAAIPEELRARRRAAKAAVNRADILDAAERTFAERGLTDGSLRDIAKQSGFSTAAIYNYFDNKQHLLAETLVRRGTELLAVIDAAANGDGTPMARLHRIVDDTVAFFETYPDFRQILRHVRESEAIITSVLTEHAAERNVFPETLMLMTNVLEEGQRVGEIREGSPGALIHLYMTLVNEHVYLAGSADPGLGSLTIEEFHELVDGALRRKAPDGPLVGRDAAT
jgi:TetR/AcrR family acrAB operon transcriptional repressor